MQETYSQVIRNPMLDINAMRYLVDHHLISDKEILDLIAEVERLRKALTLIRDTYVPSWQDADVEPFRKMAEDALGQTRFDP